MNGKRVIEVRKVNKDTGVGSVGAWGTKEQRKPLKTIFMKMITLKQNSRLFNIHPIKWNLPK